jgi:hypothetical protein
MSREYSFEHKLKRADQHLQSLEEGIERWLSTDPYRVIDQLDPKTDENVVRFRRDTPVPEFFSIVIGDCVYNLRSALDHLVYTLAARHYEAVTDNAPLAFGDIKKTQFPIFKTWDDFCRRGKGHIGCIDPRAQAIIYGLQPCAAIEPKSTWLWLLNELSNVDKHRTLNVGVVTQQGTGLVRIEGVAIESLQYNRGVNAHQRETEVARYKAFNIADRKGVQVHFIPGAKVAFYYPPVEGYHVTDTLMGIRNYIIEEVIPPLRPFL